MFVYIDAHVHVCMISCVSTGSLLASQELIPVLLLVIASHPDSKTRDQLLHMMFNLIKRPDRHQRWVCPMGGAKQLNELCCISECTHVHVYAHKGCIH